MTTVDYQNITEIVNHVRSWPQDARVSLARSILGTLEDELSPPRPKRSLRNLVGIMKWEGPPLTDEDVARIRDEAIMQKYGS